MDAGVINANVLTGSQPSKATSAGLLPRAPSHLLADTLHLPATFLTPLPAGVESPPVPTKPAEEPLAPKNWSYFYHCFLFCLFLSWWSQLLPYCCLLTSLPLLSPDFLAKDMKFLKDLVKSSLRPKRMSLW